MRTIGSSHAGLTIDRIKLFILDHGKCEIHLLRTFVALSVNRFVSCYCSILKDLQYKQVEGSIT